ncbi:MAG: hypothetical protein Q9167_003758 [Letrouitia subvulpina]
MSNTDFLGRAIDIVNKAIENDNAGDYEKAYPLYDSSLDFFLLALKWEKNPKSKDMIRTKVREYMSRAEKLKNHLAENGKGGKKAAAMGANGKATSGPRGAKVSGNGSKGDDDNGEQDADAKKLRGALQGAILTDRPNVKWEDVAGLENAKEALKEAVILPIKFPHLFVGKRQPWKGILLYGPPGTGKSYLAKAVATEARSTFFSVSSSDLVSKWMGESERLVKQLFTMARENKPSIIFIDEVDALCGPRGEGESEASRRIKTELLVQMDGVGRDSTGVLILGATNIPWQLDAAIRRRFQRRVHISLPDLPGRMKMFELAVGTTPCDLKSADYKSLGQLSDGYSGSDIAIAVQDALMQPVRKIQTATHYKKVNIEEEGGTTTEKLTPCSPGDQGAIEMNWTEVDSDMLLEPPLVLKDFVKAVKGARPTVMHTVCIGTRDLNDLIQGLVLPLRDNKDPFSIVAGVLDIAVTTAEAAKELCKLVDSLPNAPAEIITIPGDDMVSNEEALTILVGNLKDPLTSCLAALGRLMVKIQGYIRPMDGEKSRISTNELKRHFKKEMVKELTTQVEMAKVTFDSAQVNVITNSVEELAESLRRAENQRNGLINAAKEGKNSVLELIIREGANVNAKDKDGKAALHYAAAYDNVDTAQVLLNNHANINLKTNPEGSPIDCKFDGEVTPLYCAAAEGHEDMVKMLVKNKAYLNVQKFSGRTALQAALKQGKDAVAGFLIDNGADITLYDTENWAALHEAAHQGCTGIVQILLDRGANCEAKTSEETIWGEDRHWFCGATPLFLASGNGYRATVKFLMEQGANIRTRNMIGEMPIHNACWRGFKLLVLLYLDAGIGIEERDTSNQETPLIKAASTGQTDVIRLLLERGADIQARNTYGRRALEHARLHLPDGKNAEAVKVLEDWYAAAESWNLPHAITGECRQH